MLIDRRCLLLSPLRLLYLPILAPALFLLIDGACFSLPCACFIFLSLRLHYAYWSQVFASFSLALALSFYPCACTILIDRRCLLPSPLRLLYLSILAPALFLLIEGACFFLPCACSIFLSALLMYVGGVVLLRNFPFVGEVRLTVLTRFRERAIRSYRTIDRVGPSKRDFTSQSEIIVW